MTLIRSHSFRHILFRVLKILAISNYNNLNSASKLLTNNEKRKIKSGLEFLLTLRSHLHYESGRPNDKLTFDYQKIIAEKFSKEQKNSINTKVEIMMNKYFKQIGVIKIITKNLSQNFSQMINGKEKILQYLIKHKVKKCSIITNKI